MESKTDSGVKEYITPPIVIFSLIQLLCIIVSWHQSGVKMFHQLKKLLCVTIL